MKFNEKWEDIKGYEGIYQISNLGRVKSLKREIEYIGRNQYSSYKRKQIIEEKILKYSFDKDGYAQVGLAKDGKLKTKRVHFLVAQAFIPNPMNYDQINHKDENKTNNAVDNLEWCSVAYNNAYGSRSKKINQYDLKGNFIKSWKSAAEAAKELKLKKASNITSCCKRRKYTNTAYGYIWRYADEL
jgi:hypothetical protein